MIVGWIIFIFDNFKFGFYDFKEMKVLNVYVFDFKIYVVVV